MFNLKTHVPRRAVLKGVGAAISLPMLDSMIPASTAWADTPAGKIPKRFGFIGFPHGAIMDRWSPAETGTSFTMSPILQPLEPFRKHMTIVSGLRNKPAETPEPHAYIEQGWLTCVKPAEFGKEGADYGVSCDQMAVRYVGRDTRLPSLELTAAQGSARLAWRTPTQSLPQEGNPRAVFQKLFGEGDTDQERAQILAETGSILDRVTGQAKRLQASLGVQDRVVVSDYLDSVREIERRVQMASKPDERALTIPDAPIGTPNDITEYFKLMFDLMALAFQADITRVGTLLFARDLTGRTYPESEAPTSGFHGVSHHGEDPRNIALLSKINQYHIKMLAHLIANLAKTQDGDGTLLDHSLVLYGSNMGNSNQHVHYDVPHVLVGGLNGQLKGGRHLAYPSKTIPTGNLLLSILDKFDIHQDKIGDSTGRIESL